MADIRENRQQMQTLLARIGQTTYEMTSPDWTRAVVGYFLEGESGIPHQQIHIYSAREDDYVDIMEASWEHEEYDDPITELGDHCQALAELCARAGDRWTGMTFVLNRNGTFNVDYSYDPIDDYGPRFIREWQSQHLV